MLPTFVKNGQVSLIDGKVHEDAHPVERPGILWALQAA